jgi:ketosteroid isomerase-like protein
VVIDRVAADPRRRSMSRQREIVEEFVRVTERFAWTPEAARALLHPDYVQTELPNALNRRGQESNVEETLSRSEIAKKILAAQRYEVTALHESGSTVVMEARWSGTMRVDAGPLKAGQELRAHFCMVFELEGERIRRIRNYDCFEPF